MPKKEFKVIKGFNYVPKGETSEVRVDVGDPVPVSLTTEQIKRWIDRGILEAK